MPGVQTAVSADTRIATVSVTPGEQVTVTALTVGSTTITATVDDGSLAIIQVKVTPAALAGSGLYQQKADGAVVINAYDALNDTDYA